MHIHHDSILWLELHYRERLAIRRTVFCGGHGPNAVVLAGIHGDELERLYVCHRLAAWLNDLGATRPAALLGQVELFPAMNPLGLDTLKRLVPVYDTDLNRNFPGHAQGPLPQRIAEAVMRQVRDAVLVIDIHASNIFLREIPQVRINQTFADTLVPLAQRMNVDLIWLHGAVTVLEATVAHRLNSLGVPCLVVEMGVGMRITPAFTEQLVIGVLNLWRDLGVLDADLEIPTLSRIPLVADGHNVYYLNAETSGLFIPAVEHWISAHQGELLGRIVSPHHGAIPSEVRSPVHGILFTLREYPLVYEGSLMARIMATEEVGEGQGEGSG
jgi:hypothetical protein